MLNRNDETGKFIIDKIEIGNKKKNSSLTTHIKYKNKVQSY